MRSFFSNLATRLRRDQRGATAVEYGIMVSLIAVVIIVAVTLLGGTLKDTFNTVGCSVQGGKVFSATGGADGKGGCVAAP
ncbi:Flp family type IVb pilin [Arthrobacter sp. YAF17]|uniref:Flp family type IVb pilin n=1 Tax=Arthrobacter sp. YAF17 TaxID=3233077 RepID=UPI003F931208